MNKGYLLLVFISLMFGCSSNSSGSYPGPHPESIGDGLEVGALEDVGLHPAPINQALIAIREGAFGEIHSLLIHKEGKLVIEEYFPGHDYDWAGPGHLGQWVNWGVDRRHNIHSVGKSITSACIGISIDHGQIRSVNDPIFNYLPDHQYLLTNGKEKITIEHLLTMSSGLEWDEWGHSYDSVENDIIGLWTGDDDPVSYILKKPLLYQPGTEFTYSGGNMILLGEILKYATGMNIEAYCGEYLFNRLGIEAPSWSWINESGVVYAGGDQYLTPREMLKLGVLYLQGGSWNGERVIPEEWVGASSQPFGGKGNSWLNHSLRPVPPDDGSWGPRGYSYSWWTHTFSQQGKEYHAYWAFGYGGQSIRIFPDEDMVVIFTGANYDQADATVKVLKDFILPAVR